MQTYRTEGHWVADPQIYRDKKEVEEWRKKCPIEGLKNKLIQQDRTNKERLESIENEVDQIIIQAEKFAKESPEPDPKEVLKYVLA